MLTQVPSRTAERPLYISVAGAFENQIQNRSLKPGDKLPSVRELSRRLGISTATVVAAYGWLERHGTIVPRPKSGYYVAARPPRVPEPRTETKTRPPTRVSIGEIVLEIQKTARDGRMAPFGEAVIRPELLPAARLNRSVRMAATAFPQHATTYEAPAGNPRLRRQIARLAYRLSCTFSPDDVIVTSGAIEALNLAVRAVASPGDVVGVESPVCYEILQALESFGLKALEITSRPRLGPDPAELERAFRKHKIRCFLMSGSCQNPLGYILPDKAKAEIVVLAGRLRLPIIEDDSFGDVAFSPRRPRPLKSFDRAGHVLYCSTYSHIVAPGFHIGWVHGGRFRARVEALKGITTTTTPSLPQIALSEFLESGAYERHLRKLNEVLFRSTQTLSAAVAQHFPEGTRTTTPDGGFFVWVQLPRRLSGLELYQAALKEGIAIVPGMIFSAHRQFRDCVRLSCGWPWSDQAEDAVRKMGQIVERLLRSKG
jgi:DNA-binding transcriptional MocR family regulator